MKKIVFATVSVLAFAAIAADSTQFGVLSVPSSFEETIVSVPWLASGTGSDAVKVTDLFVTADLSEGDQLMYWNGSSYTCWRLNGSGEWEGANNVTAGGLTVSAGADAATLVRGNAIILKRTTVKQNYFRIMGKPFSGSETAVSLPDGSATSYVYSLIAPPSVSAVNVATGITWTGITKYDSLLLTDGTEFKYNPDGAVWKKKSAGTWTSDDLTIPAGQGAWFVSKSSGDVSKSFTLK